MYLFYQNDFVRHWLIAFLFITIVFNCFLVAVGPFKSNVSKSAEFFLFSFLSISVFNCFNCPAGSLFTILSNYSNSISNCTCIRENLRKIVELQRFGKVTHNSPTLPTKLKIYTAQIENSPNKHFKKFKTTSCYRKKLLVSRYIGFT
jgi:hypothetical protein